MPNLKRVRVRIRLLAPENISDGHRVTMLVVFQNMKKNKIPSKKINFVTKIN